MENDIHKDIMVKFSSAGQKKQTSETIRITSDKGLFHVKLSHFIIISSVLHTDV